MNPVDDPCRPTPARVGQPSRRCRRCAGTRPGSAGHATATGRRSCPVAVALAWCGGLIQPRGVGISRSSCGAGRSGAPGPPAPACRRGSPAAASSRCSGRCPEARRGGWGSAWVRGCGSGRGGVRRGRGGSGRLRRRRARRRRLRGARRRRRRLGGARRGGRRRCRCRTRAREGVGDRHDGGLARADREGPAEGDGHGVPAVHRQLRRRGDRRVLGGPVGRLGHRARRVVVEGAAGRAASVCPGAISPVSSVPSAHSSSTRAASGRSSWSPLVVLTTSRVPAGT